MKHQGFTRIAIPKSLQNTKAICSNTKTIYCNPKTICSNTKAICYDTKTICSNPKAIFCNALLLQVALTTKKHKICS